MCSNKVISMCTTYADNKNNFVYTVYVWASGLCKT
jgi:hypothetical protein